MKRLENELLTRHPEIAPLYKRCEKLVQDGLNKEELKSEIQDEFQTVVKRQITDDDLKMIIGAFKK